MRIFRLLLLPVAAVLLLHAAIYAPGRGITMIAADSDFAVPFYLVRMLTYGLFLAGAWICSKRALMAGILLALGMLGRMSLEIPVSALREWLAHDPGNSAAESVFVAGFYLVSFVLPAALCFDSFRIWRFQRSKIHNPAT